MRTIVSVTPIEVASDSRTYKMAASFSRFGFKSIVVEGQKSDIRSGKLPFSLLQVKGNVIFSRADGSAEEIRRPEWFTMEWIKHWAMRITKPFLNQMRTFASLPSASLYYLHSFYQFPAVFLKSRLLGVSYIYDAHDYYPAEDTGRFNRWLEGLCVNFAVAVVTVSSGVADLLQQEYGRLPRVIRNCYDSRLEEEPARTLRQSLGLSPKDFLIVVVGQAKDGMAVNEAVESISGMPPHVHLAFVGKNTQDYSRIVEQSGLVSKVHLVPPVTPGQVVPFVRSSDVAMILYYPRTANYENCLPNGFFQSISAELPILYPNLPEIRRLADEYGIGLTVDTQSVADIARGIKHLMNGKGAEYKKNLVRASRELSWEQEEHSLLDLVMDVLTHRESGVG